MEMLEPFWEEFYRRDDDLAFSAGAFAAAGSIGVESRGNLSLQNGGTGFSLNGDVIRQKCYGMQIHVYTSDYDRKGPMLPSAPLL